jgi:hypothetical protein
MTISPEILRPSHADSRPSAGRRRTEKIIAIALASLVCCVSVGPTACTNGLNDKNFSFGPTRGQITAAAVGISAAAAVTVVVIVEVHRSHHTVKGCVSSGPNGFQVQTQDDAKTYALAGNTANITVGDLVRFHGTKEKKVKGSAGDRTFTVEKISRDYGPCKVISAPPANAPVAR